MKSFPQIKRCNGGTSEEEVAAFESRRGIHLPSDYRSFLLEHDGGTLVENTLRLDAPGTEGYELTLRSLRGLHEEEMLFSELEVAQDCFSDRISRDFLIIGSDYGGNQFLMEVMRPHTIYWWNHDDEERQEIASNFGDLMRRVDPTPPPPESAAEHLGRTGRTEDDLNSFLVSHDSTPEICYEAAKNGNVDLLRVAIQSGVPTGHVLRIAAMNGQLEAFDFIVSTGLPVNSLMEDGRTALDWASWNDEYAAELRKRGAKLSSEL